uniref:Uncharacterized protein n=1 Tax=viral metagenome TaxID=1070528 RepID=A0A6M3M0A7_9ZZZZ
MGYFIDSEATLKTLIRQKAGAPDTSLLTADELDAELDSALARLNQLQPRVRWGSVTTVVDQQDYKVSGSDGTGVVGLRSISQCLWDPTGLTYTTDWLDDAGVMTPIEPGLSVYDNPSLLDVHYRKIKAYQDRSGGTWQQIQKSDGTYLRLLPCPSAAGNTVPFRYYVSRTLTNCEYEYQEFLVTWTAGACKVLYGTKATLISSTTMGARSTRMNGPRIVDDGEAMKQEAEAMAYTPPSNLR